MDVALIVVHCCAIKKNVIVASQLYDAAYVQLTAVVYGYENFAILFQSENFSSTPYPIHIRQYKIMDSDIQSKSETAQSIAH